MVQLASRLIVALILGLSLALQAQTGSSQLDAFLEVNLSPNVCYVGQQVRLEVRLYVRDRDRERLQVGGLAMAGLREQVKNQLFWEEKANRLTDTLSMVKLGRQTYYTQVIYRSFLFPIQAGSFRFNDLLLEAQRLDINPDASPLDLLTGKDRRQVPVVLIAPAKTLVVRSLPEEKEGNPVLVGALSMEAVLNPEVAQTGETVTLSVRLKGNGNLALAQKVMFSHPEGFAYFDPLTAHRIELSDSMAWGEKSFTFEMAPAVSGAFEFGPVRFPYFDPEKKSYDTLEVALPVLRVKGPERPEVLESPLAGFYRQGFAEASQREIRELPFMPFWAMLIAALAAVLTGLAVWRIRTAKHPPV